MNFIFLFHMTITYILCRILLGLVVLVTIGRYVYFSFSLVTKSKKAPYVPSFNRHLRLMWKELVIKPNTTMVDLWCGDGKVLRFFMKKYGMKSAEWFDIHIFAIIYGRILNRIGGYKHIHLYNKNLFKADLKKYDYIYLYLWSSQLALMEDRIFSSASKPWVIIISNSFVFKDHKPYRTIKNKRWKDALFLYKKG